MSFRLARLLSLALIGTSVATVAFAAAGPTLVWRGDITTARGVVTDVAKAWEKSGKGKIELQPFNTASGLDAVAKGTADLAGAARGSAGGSESELAFTPVAWDALVIITSPSNPVSSITLQQLHDVYYGKITNWKDLGGRDEPINAYAVASPGDGVEYSLRRLMFGRGNQPVAAPRLYVNTAKLEEGVTLDPKSFGATTLANVRGNPKIKVLSIGGIAPNQSTISSGSYPLFTPLYLVTNNTNPKAADVKEFLDFVQSDKGGALLRAHGLVPYNEGAALASMDSSRRAKILAEVGARASAGSEQPLVTSGTAVASAKAAAPAAALAQAKTKTEAPKSEFAAVTGTSVSTAPPSLKGIRGDAITISDKAARGADFAKVTSEVYFTRGKPAKVAMEKAAPVKAAKADTHKVAEAKPAKAAKPVVVAKTYKVNAGETLYSIAKKHSVDVNQLRAWNGLKDNTVRQGQVLKVGAR
jgi:phosphate transport system substrate-binding protein